MNAMPRTELLAALADLCQRYPDWRLGKILCRLSCDVGKDLWHIEDDQLLDAARRFQPPPPAPPIPYGPAPANGAPVEEVDTNVFHENTSKFTLDQLAPFEGKHVAWSLDGTRILASGDDMG